MDWLYKFFQKKDEVVKKQIKHEVVKKQIKHEVVKKQIKHEVVKNLIKQINNTIEKIKIKLFIAISAYEKNYKKYYIITVTLFILSSLVTFIEALRLIIIEYINKNDQLLINVNLFTTLINVLILSLGIVITVLSSIIRFKNYREILEELREKQNIIMEYIDKYTKQKNNLEYIYQIKRDDIKYEEIEIIKNAIAEYDTKIKSTNILKYLTTKDIIKFNYNRTKFDLKIKETILNYEKLKNELEKKNEENEEKLLIINEENEDNEENEENKENEDNILNSQKDEENGKLDFIVLVDLVEQLIQPNLPNSPKKIIKSNLPFSSPSSSYSISNCS